MDAWGGMPGAMSRLRRLVLSDRFFFVSCRLARRCEPLSEAEFKQLAQAVRERREEHGFLLTAWVFLLDHWHAIIFPQVAHSFRRLECMRHVSDMNWRKASAEALLRPEPSLFSAPEHVLPGGAHSVALAMCAVAWPARIPGVLRLFTD